MSPIYTNSSIHPAKQIKLLSRAGKHPDAIRLGKEVISRGLLNLKDLAKVQCSLVTAYLRAKDLIEAEKLGKQTVELFPENPVARTSLLQVLLAQNKLDEAEELGKQTVELFPSDPVTNVLLIVTQIRIGNNLIRNSKTVPAEKILQKACELFYSKILPLPLHPVHLHIAKRLAEHNINSNDNGVGVKILLGPDTYSFLLEQCRKEGLDIKDLSLRRNSIHLNTEELEYAIGKWVRTKMWQDNYFEYGLNKCNQRFGTNRVAIRVAGQPEPYIHK
jgi:tetratricopeptide (TPR) repeat protein